MPLSDDQIKQLADLAKLEPTQGEIERLRHELEKMMKQVETVQEADTSGLELKMILGADTYKMRPDEPQVPAGNLAEASADHAGGAVLVPKVIA